MSTRSATSRRSAPQGKSQSSSPTTAAETEAAIRARAADVVYQARLEHDGWRGIADFVERQPDGSYEVVDTKLARRAKPAARAPALLLHRAARAHPGHAPEAMHVVNGLGERETFRPGDFAAYYRRLRRRFLDAVESGRDTYPYPVDHCGALRLPRPLQGAVGRGRPPDARRRHLAHQVERLEQAGITTLDAARRGRRRRHAFASMRPATFEGLRHQAELQLHQRRTGEHRVDLLPLEDDRGFALMPEPSPGRHLARLRGRPLVRAGARARVPVRLGLSRRGRRAAVRLPLGARPRGREGRASSGFVDYVVERRRRFPGMHVYHYAPYERTALTRLMGEHATREEEIDDLLRGEVLVDLFRVTRQALRASVPSYSIKEVEELYGFERARRGRRRQRVA